MTDAAKALLDDLRDLEGAKVVIETGEHAYLVTLREDQRTMAALLADLHGLTLTAVNRGTATVSDGTLRVTIDTQPRLTDRARAYALALWIAYDMTVHMPQRGTLVDHAPSAGRSVRTLMNRGEFNAPIQLPTAEMETLAQLYATHAGELIATGDDYETIALELVTRHTELIEQARS